MKQKKKNYRAGGGGGARRGEKRKKEGLPEKPQRLTFQSRVIFGFDFKSNLPCPMIFPHFDVLSIDTAAIVGFVTYASNPRLFR